MAFCLSSNESRLVDGSCAFVETRRDSEWERMDP